LTVGEKRDTGDAILVPKRYSPEAGNGPRGQRVAIKINSQWAGVCLSIILSKTWQLTIWNLGQGKSQRPTRQNLPEHQTHE
jgi:hypothetical protein